MRDVIVTLIVFGLLPYVFKRPYLGALMWIWISVMNPHSQGWGFARSFPFAAIIAAATILSLVVSKEKKGLPRSPVTWIFISFVVWMMITSMFAFNFDQIGKPLTKVLKIMGMTLVVMMILKERRHLHLAIWTIVFSIGYYGVKGGIFSIRTGGNARVWGPEGTFIEGNNEMALALVMVIPLMYYLLKTTQTNRWGRYAFHASMILCALASLTSYSRGALLAIGAMAVFLWLKSKEKIRLGLVMALAIPPMLMFMPQQWYSRMETIQDYKADESAMGRVNAWHMAFNLAKDRFFGGGFEIYNPMVFKLYAPVPEDIHAAHSIYFQIMGEHGFVGLLLYLLLGFFTWRSGSWIVKHTAGRPDMKWANDMATMIQVSLLGFMVGGAFLSLAYFDVPYYLMAVMVALRILIGQELQQTLPSGAVKPAVAEPPRHAVAGNRRDFNAIK
jgi:probable O-glycosylation ligase (exosortase A-associated)